jgi:sushi-domain containing secreted protein; with a signal peptide, low complexity region followed by a sushi domain
LNQEKSKNKKKIAVITLFSALVLGGVSATAYLMTKPSSNGDRPQHLTTTDSSNGSEVEFVESSDDGSTTSKDKEKSKEKDKEKTSSSSSSDDKKENASSSSQSNHSNRREGATPIDSSRVANTREEGANSIAPITQVRDIINRAASSNRTSTTGSNSITAPEKTSKEQEDEARRLAEIEARRKPKTDNTNTIPTSPAIPTVPTLPITPVIPIVPSVTPVIPIPTPAPVTPTPVEEEKPAETKPAEPETPSKPVEERPSEIKPSEIETPTKPAEEKPSETKPAETKPAETKPEDKKPEEKPADKPAETKPEDKKPTETKPAEEKPTDTNKEEQNVTATIRTQEDLNSYLKKTGRDLTGDTVNFLLSEDVKFPKETYKFLGKTTFNFPANPEGHTLDFNGSSFLVGNKSILRFDATGKHGKDDSDYLTIKNFIVYGSIEEDTAKDGNVIIKSLNKDIFEGDGRFSARIAKASNMKFENATFNNAHGAGSHLFDVAGSDHIIFDKITAAGYGGKDLSEEEVERRFNKDPHVVYSEAIQIDSFLPGAYGHVYNLRNSILSGLEVDNKPSSDITITNSTFTSYVGFTGQDIADGNTAKPIVRNFGATVGSHTKGSENYKNITITNNKFENTIGFGSQNGEKNWASRLAYPIHLIGIPEDLSTIKVEDNTFNDKVFARTGIGKFVHGIYSVSRELISPTKPEENKPSETKPAEEKPTETKPADTKPAEPELPIKEPEAPRGKKGDDKGKDNNTGKTDKDNSETGKADKR